MGEQRVDHRFREPLTHAVLEMAIGAHARPGDQDQIGADQRDQVGEAVAEHAAGLGEQRQRAGIAAIGQPADRLHLGFRGMLDVAGVEPEHGARVAMQRVIRGIGFDAAALAAHAERTVELELAVAELGGGAGAAVVEPPVESQRRGQYFAIIPAIFAATLPALGVLNVMGLKSPQSAILSAVIFNALIIIFLIPLALRGVEYRPTSASKILQKNVLIYGVGGVIIPFIGIKLIDVIVNALGLA